MHYSFITLMMVMNVVQSTNVYNYYELAVQKWCSSDYMIHGLWPQINSTAYPQDCKTVSYHEPTGTLLTNMNTYWHECDDTLWEHEWEKHGSCVQEQNNTGEDEFFNTTLSLFLNNIELTERCKNDDCIMACFDLDFELMDCPQST